MKSIFVSTFLFLTAFAVVEMPIAAEARSATSDQTVRDAVMKLIKAETMGDGLYHIDDKYNGKKLALKFDRLDHQIRQEGGEKIVTGLFREGSKQHRIEFHVSTSGGDTGANVQVARFVLDGQEVPAGAAYDKRPTAVETTRRMTPGRTTIEERGSTSRDLPQSRSSISGDEEGEKDHCGYHRHDGSADAEGAEHHHCTR